MHDIDRTQFEADELTSGYGGELEQAQSELPLNEAEELELASELLEVSDEMELEAFLGDVFRTVGRAVGQFARSDAGRALGGIVKDAIRHAMPGVTGGPPGAGLAQQAGSLLGLELEGLSSEDKEFESARQLIRFAGNAYRNAAWAPRHMSAQAIARSASLGAARRYAPGLLRTFDHRRRGSWQSRSYGSGGGRRWGGQSSYYRPRYYQSAGYQPTGYQPTYYRRRRRSSYGQGVYPWGYWAMPEPEPAPPPEPPPPPPPPPMPEPPAAAAEPAPAGPAAAALEPGPPAAAPSSGELEAMGMNGHRRGRWVRRDGVLIVYGA
jgi:hypothetical protein